MITSLSNILKEMKTPIGITLPNKSKAVDSEDYRTISMTSHITKIILKIKEQKKSYIKKEVPDKQFGFCENCGIKEAILCLRMLT